MKLATIENITELKPHPNADRLELATVKGWQAVVRKGDFEAGQAVVFIVIDTIVPRTEWSEFLFKPDDGKKEVRLKTIKLRGQHSQGLVLPLGVLPCGLWNTGADVGCELGVKKYEKEIPAQLSGKVKCNFPQHLAPKTDEDNALSYPEILETILKHDMLVISTKMNGSSATFIIEDHTVAHVCSRNMSLEKTEGNAFWHAIKGVDFRNLEATGKWVFQGELMGPGIQGNELELDEPTVFIFQVQNPEGRWLDYSELVAVCDRVGINHCLNFVRVESKLMTVARLQSIADELTLPNGKPAEGIVIRPEEVPAAGNGRPLSCKILNRNYGDN